MSDPLSVAGTAVGITSLGIQVCQSLVWYLRSVNGRKAEIAEDLSEVQSLISIFYALNDILPKINQTRCIEATTIKRCLEDSEGKLLELQQLLIRLRGPEQCTTNREKMREAGRTLVYPFRADTLKSLRQSLRVLLSNLNLAIDITSLDSQVTNCDKIDNIGLAIQGLDNQSQDSNAGIQDLNTKMQQNLSQLRSLESTITDSLTELKQRISQAEWAIQDLGNDISGKLTITETEVVSTRRVMAEMLTDMAGKLDSQSAEISQLDQGPLLPNDSPEHVTRHTSMARSSSYFSPSICNCRRQSRSSGFSFAFWNLKFEFQQQVPGKHRRSCKFFGIDGQTQRRINAQFPLKLAWMSARMTLACMEYTLGTGSPGCSVRFKNVVPGRCSPVVRVLSETGSSIQVSRSTNETIQLLEGAEREILSLYRDRQASPGDRDEDGRCHLRMFIEALANPHYSWVEKFGANSADDFDIRHMVWRDNSVLATVLRILQVLGEIVQTDDINVDLKYVPFLFYNDDQIGDAHLTRHRGSELVSYWARTQQFDPESLLNHCVEYNTIPALHSVPDLMDVMEFPAMMRAIVSRSVIRLQQCILSNPTDIKKRVWGYTTLQFSVGWPEGLEMLLTTEARNLVHDDTGSPSSWPTTLALDYKCEKSLDMLMKAGFRFDLDWWWRETSAECAMVAARQLFERRTKLFELARNRVQNFEGQYTCNTSEEEAECLYYELVAVGIQVDRCLEVQHGCATVFHCSSLPLDYFRIFFENGFRNHSTHDKLGFTAAMVYRGDIFSDNMDDAINIETPLATFQWLREKEFLDYSPEDPYNLGLNTDSTGWHYLAAYAYFQARNWRVEMLLRQVSRSSVRDCCVCWCIPEGEGCSPLVCILKAHADTYWAPGPADRKNVAKLLDVSGCGAMTLTIMTQFVRFLTFEALEMTHTCCHFRILDKDALEFVTFEDAPSYDRFREHRALVILDRGAKVITETRGDKVEQRNAALLDSLMEEFSGQLNMGEPTTKKFGHFLKGPWRSRIEQLFAVDEDIVNGMKEYLREVKTHVLPDRVQCFLDFDYSDSEG
ncbi:hypothetical protein CDV36_002229 [Fusarium kuroshium]|uniref:Fungal N-terminal domain-containing protein n=1 Tax=Fusarium kuroshium TaxID=2010991 RepID=A0A3M2SLR4_9HYPO|nr:hypothetical protein CDV36_002229 [Fusarium kuroshium]